MRDRIHSLAKRIYFECAGRCLVGTLLVLVKLDEEDWGGV